MKWMKQNDKHSSICSDKRYDGFFYKIILKNAEAYHPRSKRAGRFRPKNSGNGRKIDAEIWCPNSVTGFLPFPERTGQNRGITSCRNHGPGNIISSWYYNFGQKCRYFGLSGAEEYLIFVKYFASLIA
jgi:hypothetical protein